MAIKKVWLDESASECISCCACAGVCDAVLSVPEKMQEKEGVVYSQYEEDIKNAAEGCPAQVIKYE